MINVTEFLTTLNFYAWFGLAAFLLIVELLIASTGFLLWIAIAAALTGVVQWFVSDMFWYYQYLVFVVFILLCSVVGKKYLQRFLSPRKKIILNRRAEQYVGRVFFLEQAIVNGRGTVHVDDSFWRVSGPDLPVGTQVRVVGVDGVILQVVACDQL